jgi:uncharacterized protein YyaL (SSP411 family)
VSLHNLLILSHFVNDAGWREKIDRAFRFFGTRLDQMGRAVPMAAAALSAHVAGLQQIVIVGDNRALLERAATIRYRPFAIVLSLSPAQQQALATLLPIVKGMSPVGGAAAAYVCANFTCRPPATTAEELSRSL